MFKYAHPGTHCISAKALKQLYMIITAYMQIFSLALIQHSQKEGKVRALFPWLDIDCIAHAESRNEEEG